MYKNTRGMREWTLDPEQFDKEFLNKCNNFDLNKELVTFYSQQDEDKYIIQYLLKDKISDGTFLEIGGCDGVLYSNTKTLEDYFGFNGIIIEPQKDYFKQLKINRNNSKNELYNCAVSNSDDDFLEFIGGGAGGGILHDNDSIIDKFKNFTPYSVQNKKMKEILKNSKFEYIDFMVIDVEGSELSLLKSIDFNFPIFCIIIEAHSNEQEKNKIFGDYLKENGFTFKERQRGNEIWLNLNYFRKHLFNCAIRKNHTDIKKSNEEINKLIQKNEPFIVSRMGIGSESYITHEYDITKKLNTKYLNPSTGTLFNAGIYFDRNDHKMLELYCKLYSKCLSNSDLLASFQTESMYDVQNYYSEKHCLSQIHSRSLEPFYQIQENIKPWTHNLLGKKVLIIHPFVESFKKQIACGFQIFKDKQIFLDDQQFVWYKSYQTIAGNNIHKNWLITFTTMCKEISKLDFDIALLGCGGYGLPLCDYIKSKLNKSAIYIGGGLQLLFGVMGKRWENREDWKQIIKENDCKFIKPSGNEICDNLKTIENGCYI